MINYETANSPHFEANKLFCEQVTAAFQGDWSGFCNSYGYEIETKYSESNLNYSIKFQKSQTTQNGVVIPVDARDSVQLDVAIDGFPNDASFIISKSWLKSIFTANDLKDQLPKNYSASINFEFSNAEFVKISNFIQTYSIEKFELANGKMHFAIITSVADISLFKNSLQELTNIFQFTKLN